MLIFYEYVPASCFHYHIPVDAVSIVKVLLLEPLNVLSFARSFSQLTRHRSNHLTIFNFIIFCRDSVHAQDGRESYCTSLVQVVLGRRSQNIMMYRALFQSGE
jgi:hypothetical protein